VYVEDVTTNGYLPNLAKLWIVTRKQGERGYPTGHISTSSTKEGTWEYLSKTVLVPADVKEINVRIENARLGKVWFDDVKIVKGNTSQTVIVEESNYYPFGLKHKGYNNVVSSNGNSTAQKFGFEGVELEESLGLNLHEMDWRHYDASIGRFMVVDPMAEQRNWLTPYNFVQNNPILRVDPTGLLDDYGLDQAGNVELIKKTDDDTDTLYSVTRGKDGELVKDGNGEVKKNEEKGSVTVSKQKDGSSILSDLSESKVTNTYLDADDIERTSSSSIITVSGSQKDDLFKVFGFLADNSNVEWSVNKYELMPGSPDYQLGTYHNSNLSPGLTGYRQAGKWLGMVHSHPNQPTATDRTQSLYGDLSVGASYLSKYGKNLPYLVYFPNTGNTAKMRVGKTATGKTAAKKPIRGLKNYKF
jgi:RHS repeat-associated protein